ncbi:hypothetical protein CAEBREN_24583 [Caenorhabditis brenneri]|uniref:Uncharacterized protein n=1 Tax=Caenorhabditis brenneri TaxID=135651 RepID=G0P9I2_CAEBE|nr:hypothetical protein CAEBREN_24583 [Caenorhabditis brenneri]
MFPGYTNNYGRPPPDREFEAPKDRRSQTRLAVQAVAKRDHNKFKTQKEIDEENSVFQQSGYGESDSDDDNGGVKMEVNDPEHEKNVEACFLLPIHRNNQKSAAKEARQNQVRDEFNVNPYSSFPSNKRAFNPYGNSAAASSSSSSSGRKHKKRSRSRESSRRRRSRSSSLESNSSRFTTSSRSSRRERDDSEERRRRKKKKKRRRHSSSSSSSSSDSDRTVRSVPVKKVKEKQRKYEYLRPDTNFATDYDWLFRETKLDGGMFIMGNPPKEVARIRLGSYAIVGMENNEALFRRIYGSEISKQARSRDFYAELAALERRPAEDRQKMERDFAVQTGQVVNGYWRLRTKKCILNEIGVEQVDPMDYNLPETLRCELERLRAHVKSARSDDQAMLRLIELEEIANFCNKDSFTGTEIKDLAEHHLRELRISIKQAPQSVGLHLKKLECFWKSMQDVTEASVMAKGICDTFPQNPLVWERCLDFFQYNLIAYDDHVMSDNFLKCLDKAHDMLAGIMVSHVITDLPAFRSHYLATFIRYLKWLLAVGQTPIALASIQSTMEFNVGFATIENIDERYRQLSDFWETGYPRIGDLQGSGGSRMLALKHARPDVNEKKWESEEYGQLVETVMKGAKEILIGDDLRLNWVRYERFMADADARVKRTPFAESDAYNADQEVDSHNFYEEVEFRTKNMREPTRKKQVVTFYPSIGNEDFEFVQPMLELLGIRFRHSTECYSSTEQIISEWISDSTFREFQTNFDEIPTYTERTCGEVGLRILHLLISRRHEICQEFPKDLDKLLVKYAIAKNETMLIKMEKELEFYKLKHKQIISVMQNMLISEVDTKFKDIMLGYPRMSVILGLIGADRVVTWAQKALDEQKELKRIATAEKRNTITRKEVKIIEKFGLSEKDENDLSEVRNKLFLVLGNLNKQMMTEETFQKSLGDPTLSYVPLQLRLYSTIIMARMYVMPKCQERIRCELAKALMDDPKDVIEGMDRRGTLWSQVNLAMKELLGTIGARDEDEGMCGIPELPRAGALCISLRNALYFVFLGKNPLARKTIDEITTEALQKFEEYERNAADFRREAAEKEQDRIDIQFILDTLIALFSQENYRTYYCENYKKLILAASNTFPCHSKYMKLLSELYSTNRRQLIQLRTIIDERNKVIREKMKTQADVSFGRRLLQNSLAIMYATKKICDREETNAKFSLYRTYLAEAKQLHDPAIYRMTMKAAAAVSMYTLKEEAYIHAVGHCKYARNIHLDLVELVDCPDEQSAKNLVIQTTIEMLTVATEEQLTVFMDNFDTLDTFRDVIRQQQRDKAAEQLFLQQQSD